MRSIRFTIDGRSIEAAAGATILQAARNAGIYIPTLCHHPDLPPAKDSAAAPAIYQGGLRIDNARPEEAGKGCGLCLVEIKGQGQPVGSCATEAQDGADHTSFAAEQATARR